MPVLFADTGIRVGLIVITPSDGVAEHANRRGFMPVTRKARGVNGIVGEGINHALFMVRVRIGLMGGKESAAQADALRAHGESRQHGVAAGDTAGGHHRYVAIGDDLWE